MAQLIHCHSLSLAPVKSRLVLPFWYRLTQVVLEKRPLNGCCSVVVFFMESGLNSATECTQKILVYFEALTVNNLWSKKKLKIWH